MSSCRCAMETSQEEVGRDLVAPGPRLSLRRGSTFSPWPLIPGVCGVSAGWPCCSVVVVCRQAPFLAGRRLPGGPPAGGVAPDSCGVYRVAALRGRGHTECATSLRGGALRVVVGICWLRARQGTSASGTGHKGTSASGTGQKAPGPRALVMPGSSPLKLGGCGRGAAP